MKQYFYVQMKAYLRSQLLTTRECLQISQAEMAHRLLMSVRAYVALESGQSCCSLITVLLFLSRCCSDRENFIEGLLRIFEVPETEIF